MDDQIIRDLFGHVAETEQGFTVDTAPGNDLLEMADLIEPYRIGKPLQ